MELRILDLNTWHGLYARSFHRAEKLEPDDLRERRTGAMLEGIRALDPHVVALQECYPQPAFTERVAAELGYEQVSQVSNAGLRIFGAGYPLGIDTGEGSAILARPGLKLRSLGRIALSGYGYTGRRVSLQWVDKRMALACAIEVEGKPLHVVTFHVRYDWATFDMFEKAWAALLERTVVEGDAPERLVRSVQSNMLRRDREIDALAAWVSKLQGGAPVVLVGDLNIDDDAPQLAAFAQRLEIASTLQLVKDTRPTWDPHNNPNIAPSASFTHPDGTKKGLSDLVGAYHDQLLQRPDHAFVSQSLAPSVLDARVVLDQPVDGVFGSDHYGILTTLRV
ncbi:MAG: endonuclease/exonuclease/phosphatase family protein [Planctomycetota bacterium]